MKYYTFMNESISIAEKKEASEYQYLKKIHSLENQYLQTTKHQKVEKSISHTG